MGYLCKLIGHRWRGCKCARCDLVRDEAHDWNGCKCRVCGRARSEGHRYENGICAICGRRLNRAEMAAALRRSYEAWSVDNRRSGDRLPRTEADALAAELLDQAWAGLPREAAEDLICACLEALLTQGSVWDFLGRPMRPIPESILRHVRDADLSALTGLHHALWTGSPPQDLRSRMDDLKRLIDFAEPSRFTAEQVIHASKKDRWKKDERRQFLLNLGVADGDTVTDCDLGRHDWVLVKTETEPGDGDDWGFSCMNRTYGTYRCRRCGLEETR